MKKTHVTLAALAAAWLIAALPAHAQQSLSALYQAARGHDSTYQSALAQYQAELANAAQARAGLLPSVSLGAEATRSRASRYKTRDARCGTPPQDGRSQ